MFVHANDAAMGDSNFERREADFYPTPEWVTEALIPFIQIHVGPETPVWECACGTGDMAEVLRKNFDTVTASDLHDYGYRPSVPGIDFLSYPLNLNVRTAIITNPPYGDLAEAFIRRALLFTKKSDGVVCMLLRNEYDCSKGRVDLFLQPPFARKVVLTSRPRWIPDSTGAPRHNYAFFIWDWAWASAPELSYAMRGKLK